MQYSTFNAKPKNAFVFTIENIYSTLQHITWAPRTVVQFLLLALCD
jgi:hypothetical protein